MLNPTSTPSVPEIQTAAPSSPVLSPTTRGNNTVAPTTMTTTRSPSSFVADGEPTGTTKPSGSPTNLMPSLNPTTNGPTVSAMPTTAGPPPTSLPTGLPTVMPTPTDEPTKTPTREPTPSPTQFVTSTPTTTPTSTPTTPAPSTPGPSAAPSPVPTQLPCELVQNLPEAPDLESAQFSESGARLLVNYEAPTNRGGRDAGATFRCHEVLDFVDADRADCFWVNASQIDADVASTMLIPGDLIRSANGSAVVAACTEGARCDCFEPAVNISTVVAGAPENSVTPAIVIQGPTVTSVCENITFSASQTTGSGGRQLRYEWGLSCEDGALMKDPSLEAILDRAIDQANTVGSMLSLSANDLSAIIAVSQYVDVQLTVTNFLEASANATSRVVLNLDKIPQLTFVGGTSFQIRRDQDLSIEAEASATDCDDRVTEDRQVEIQWDLVLAGEEQGSVDTSSSNRRFFRLDAYTLESQRTYEVRVTAIDRLTMLNTTESAELRVDRGPVTATIDGGDRRSASIADIVRLSAAGSRDWEFPADETEANSLLAYNWSCTAISVASNETVEHDCGIIDLSSSDLEISAFLLPAGTYEFNVEVTSLDGLASATASTVLTLERETPPTVVIRPLTNVKVRREDKLTITADVASEATNFIESTWSLASGDLADGRSLTTAARTELSLSSTSGLLTNATYAHDLVLAPLSLVAGGSYAFTLSASATLGASIGFATIDIQVYTPPSSGSLVVAPAEGFVFFTQFELAAIGWVADSDALPLEYQFVTEDGAILRTFSRDNALLNARLPKAPDGTNNLTLSVVVSDALGATGSASTTVQVTEPFATPSPTSQRLDDVTESLTEVTQEALDVAFASYSLDSVCQIATASGGIAGDDPELRALLVTAINTSLTILVDNRRDEVEQVIAALLPPVSEPSALARDTALNSLEIADTIAEAIRVLGLDGASSPAPATTVDVLSVLLETGLFANGTFEAASTDEESSFSAAELVLRAMDTVNKAVSASLVVNEAAFDLTAPNLRSTSQVFSAALGEGGTSSHFLTSGNASADVPVEAGIQYNASMTEFDVNPYGWTADAINSDVLRFELNATNTDVDGTVGDPVTNVKFVMPGVTENDRADAVSRNMSAFDVTIECECGFRGVKEVVCPDNITHRVTCDGRVPGAFNFTCNSSRIACSIFDDGIGAWVVPSHCKAVEDDDETRCECEVESGTVSDFSTVVELRRAQQRYFAALDQKPSLAKSRLVLLVLAGIVVLTLLGCIAGSRMDRRERNELVAVPRKRALFAKRKRTFSWLGGSSGFIFGQDHQRAFHVADSWDRFWRTLIRRHPFLNWFLVYNDQVPRAARAWKLGLEVSLFFLALGIEVLLEYPSVNCDKFDDEDTCERDKSVGGAHNLCQWDTCSASCTENDIGHAVRSSTEHYVAIMLVTALVVPLVAVLDWTFIHILIAPAPCGLSCSRPVSSPIRGSDLEDVELGDGPNIVDNAAAVGAPPQPDAEAKDDTVSPRARSWMAKLRPRPFRWQSSRHSLGTAELVYPGEAFSSSSSDGSDDDDVQIKYVTKGEDDADDRFEAAAAIAKSHEEKGDDAAHLDGDEPYSAAHLDGDVPYSAPQDFSGVIEASRRFLIQDATEDDEDAKNRKRRPSLLAPSRTSVGTKMKFAARRVTLSQRRMWRKATSSPAGLCVPLSRVSSRKKQNERKQIKLLATEVRKAVLSRQRELQECMANVRTTVGDPAAKKRCLRMLENLEVQLLTKWRWVNNVRAWERNIADKVGDHVRTALELKGELDGIIGETREETRNLRIRRVIEFEKSSRLTTVERKIYRRTIQRSLWQQDVPTSPPGLGIYIIAWLVVLALAAAVVVVTMVTATSLGRGKTRLWLYNIATAVGLFYVVIIPLEILVFDVFFPGLLSERLDKIHDPTRLRRFPFSRKLPDSPTFYLLQLCPDDLADNPNVVAYALSTTDDVTDSPGRGSGGSPGAGEVTDDLEKTTNRDLPTNDDDDGASPTATGTSNPEFYQRDLPDIYDDTNWQPVPGTRFALCLSAIFLRFPDSIHEIIFEEAFIILVILSRFFTNVPWLAEYTRDEDRREIMAMTTVLVFFFVLTLLVIACKKIADLLCQRRRSAGSDNDA